MQKYADLVLEKFFSLEGIWIFVGAALIFPIVFMVYSLGFNPPSDLSVSSVWALMRGMAAMLIISVTLLIYQIPLFLVYCSVDLYLRIKNIPTVIRFTLLLLLVIVAKMLTSEWLGTNGIFHYDRFWGAPMGILQLVSIAIMMAALTSGRIRRKLGV